MCKLIVHGFYITCVLFISLNFPSSSAATTSNLILKRWGEGGGGGGGDRERGGGGGERERERQRERERCACMLLFLFFIFS